MQVCKRQLAGETVCTAGSVIIIVIMILVTLMIMTIILIITAHIMMINIIMRIDKIIIGNCMSNSVITLYKHCLCMLLKSFV